jgi:2,4-dienoyl-CoA reductase-like NADH-dependent reductase (Old Yellow Enzyme family)
MVQLCHPGRQSPLGAGSRNLFARTIAPSAVPLNIGDGLIARFLRTVVFGTPKEMSVADIELVIRQFVDAARLAAESGFAGIELHGAHGYLLGEFTFAMN